MPNALAPTQRRSSGDLIIDRRYSYVDALVADGDFAGAADLLEQIVVVAPNWAAAWFRLGEVEALRGAHGAAARAFARVLALDPQDELGAALHLARAGTMTAPQQAPEAYVRNLFDHYAAHFDAHLVEKLAYQGPELVYAAVAKLGTKVGKRHFKHTIDLGCGTGLSGAVFRASTESLTGIDLSAAMIAQARDKGLYDRLVVASINEFFADEPAASCDLLIAVDVLCYFGDLAPVMRAAKRVLMPHGLFAMSVQKGEAGFAVSADLRFAHAPAYLHEIAEAQGLSLVVMNEAALRRDAGADVMGLVVVLQKPD